MRDLGIPYCNIYSTRYNIKQFILSGNCSTCFGWYHHPSGAQTTLSTASGICHSVTATCRYRGRVGTGLSELRVDLKILYQLILDNSVPMGVQSSEFATFSNLKFICAIIIMNLMYIFVVVC